MKISLNILKQLTKSLEISTKEIENKLTSLGIEVEGVSDSYPSFYGVVVGEIKNVFKHPNSDKLKLCQVDVKGQNLLSIVCGASNVSIDSRVAVAMIGSKLHLNKPEPLIIERRSIRGVESEGMLCSENELGLSEDANGIMILNKSYPIGSNLSELIPRDTVFDITVTPNRADVLSHIDYVKKSKKLEILTTDCSHYVGTIVKHVMIRPSPIWLQQQLRVLGIKPINNVVDVTNYVSALIGKPLHAFDLEKISGEKITVKSGNPFSEKFIGLDGKEYTISNNMITICDNNKVLALGGILGGMNSAVGNETKHILLESACFNPVRIRLTSKKLGLQTDASYRFERGIDSTLVRQGAELAIRLILEIAGGSNVECFENECEFLPKRTVKVNFDFVKKMLGMELDLMLIEKIGFECESKDSSGILFRIPSWRLDVATEADIVEEVARLYGYDNIPVAEYLISSYPKPSNKFILVENLLHEKMVGLGFNEIITSPLISEQKASLFSSDYVKTINSISQDHTSLRGSLLPGFLQVISHNQNRGITQLRMFEVGNIFALSSSVKDDLIQGTIEGYMEKTVLGFCITGSAFQRNWIQEKRDVTFYDCRSIVEGLARSFFPKYRLLFHETKNLELNILVVNLPKRLEISELCIGRLRVISKDILTYFDLKNLVFYVEIDISQVIRLVNTTDIKIVQPSKYPVVRRDLAFLVKNETSVQDMIETIYGVDEMVTYASMFDMYHLSIDDKSRSCAFRVELESNEATLNEAQIQNVISRIEIELEKTYGAKLRA
ncbi:hypothetical protein CHS0354_000464 [Potamilus streckersoni]|uniref:Phenylalanine--tRNA ligase beta subunit n=1 Tax=Potamilus streckersoni TaxID=2493646 RepID=A0AAE0T6T5_9BIVA|nr:hypothetical protein CHS0354_000464 [Potamilus streckersoni]